jgi:hypothetical protein
MVVPSEASDTKEYIRWNRLYEYVSIIQPRQIKQNITKTLASYKKRGKKYSTSGRLSQSDINGVYKRFNVSQNFQASTKAYITYAPVDYMHATECYLAYKINGKIPNTCNACQINYAYRTNLKVSGICPSGIFALVPIL